MAAAGRDCRRPAAKGTKWRRGGDARAPGPRTRAAGRDLAAKSASKYFGDRGWEHRSKPEATWIINVNAVTVFIHTVPVKGPIPSCPTAKGAIKALVT